MKNTHMSGLGFLCILLLSACNPTTEKGRTIDTNTLMIRMAEVEIEPHAIYEYTKMLKEEAEASVRLEPGVLSIYPMYQKDDPTKISILEIYADKNAYESHLQTSHFKKYKSSTMDMVKALHLIDMEAIDKETMAQIFSKIKR